ncbi:MAG: response regulator [Opitutaceae bacterium]
MTAQLRSRILLVDDDPAGAELTLAALSAVEPDADVNVVADGEEALDYLAGRCPFERADDEPPHAVLLDLKMPKIDGHEVLREIRADPRLCRMRVVVLTSSDQERDRELSRTLGSDHYLVKPPTIAALIEQLKGCSHLFSPTTPGPLG